eukprot:m.4369 g.4369  ORF g.4369 m.4369 type:complete len:1002 (+) comp10615_c0_seq2:6-3011(+)
MEPSSGLVGAFLGFLFQYFSQSEVDNWLKVRDRLQLQSPLRTAGVYTIKDLVNFDIDTAGEWCQKNDCDSVLEEQSLAKKWLEFRSWLKTKGFDPEIVLSMGLVTPEAVEKAPVDGEKGDLVRRLKTEAIRDGLIKKKVFKKKNGRFWAWIWSIFWTTAKVAFYGILIMIGIAVTVVVCIWTYIRHFLRSCNGQSVGRALNRFFQSFRGFTNRIDQRRRNQSARSRVSQFSQFQNYVWSLGHYSTLEWISETPLKAGQTLKFKIKVQKKLPFGGSHLSHANVSVTTEDGKEVATVVNEESNNSLLVMFTTRKSGKYDITAQMFGFNVRGSPLTKEVAPEDVCVGKCHFEKQEKSILIVHGSRHSLTVVLRDQYGNLCDSDSFIHEQGLHVHIAEPDSVDEKNVSQTVKKTVRKGYFDVSFTLYGEGYYEGKIMYFDVNIQDANFSILCVDEALQETVKKSAAKKHFNLYYEARLLGDSQKTSLDKPKKVYCYISPKQISIKEFKLLIFPKKLHTFRVCPGTKFTYGYKGVNYCKSSPRVPAVRKWRLTSGPRTASVSEEPVHYDLSRRGSAVDELLDGGVLSDLIFTLDDGYQKVTLSSKNRNELGALFIHFLSQKMGGSADFKDKQTFFWNELKDHHKSQSRKTLMLSVQRHGVLKHVMEMTNDFKVKDWCKPWEVSFQGERGVDWGGVGRELVVLLFDSLLDPSNGLFQRFKKDDPQALMHPCHTDRHKTKCFEFAGRLVGKCLYETAMGNPRYVKARFSRSFLAQIVGLRVTYMHFESDDPEFFVTKVKYVKENDVEDLDLVFAEDVYTDGKLETFPLKAMGEDIAVTNESKKEYLDLVAQFRLVDRVRSEMEAFVKGLGEIVPIDLLSIFDENELELLMCGASEYNVDELKQNSITEGSWMSSNVLSWFWTAVSSLTQEEIAQLLQFTTGSSQIPPGGFSELSPRFRVTHSPSHINGLPTAHTCFNQICLPDYESYEQLQSSLLLAIKEGSFGFEIA